MQRGLPPQSVLAAFKNSRVNLADMVESLYQPLYDYQTLAATAVASQAFFQVPIGGAGSKTIADTNMTLAGQLPAGQAFVVTGAQVEVLPASLINLADVATFADDVYAICEAGALRLTIGSKAYIEQGNLMKFPPVNRIALDSAVSDSTADTTASAQYAQAAGREFSIIPVLLESSQNFDVTLIELAALPSTVAGRIGVTLNGYLFRNAQ